MVLSPDSINVWSDRPKMAVLFVAAMFLLAGCAQGRATALPGATSREATVVLPTQAPTSQPTPPNTRVLPIEVLTPPPSPTITPIPDEVMGLVVNVIDGDTIAVVLDGDPGRQAYQVRYIGIDAPNNLSSDPWGVAAYETNKKLVNLKIVRLERDQSDFDAEGYLLRHVYFDNQLVSLALVEQGLARAAIEEPDTAFESEIVAAEAQAREARRGLWGPQPPTPTVSRRPVETSVTEEPAATVQATATGQTEATAEPTEETPTPPEATATDTPTAEPTQEPTEEPPADN